MKAIWDALVTETRNFVSDTGFSRVVLGLSGGIDSSIVSCIAASALGKDNVLAVLMPSPYSSEGSITDSVQLARNWGFDTVQIPIAPLMDAFSTSLAPVFDGAEEDTTEENIQARIRAVLLMALSNKQRRLLLNTCNKSEDYVGYCTLYGDSCGAVAPIGGLFKTEVYALAEWINAEPELPNIPESILTKAPSAELRPEQKDTDSLPPYETLDAILRQLLEERKSADDVVAAGFERDEVRRIAALMEASEFKRRQSPPPIEIRK